MLQWRECPAKIEGANRIPNIFLNEEQQVTLFWEFLPPRSPLFLSLFTLHLCFYISFKGIRWSRFM
ncbi:hypothetical protein E2C01_096801 [Portunus trituberculatus]|uniref:Uncharacterized protein n=1 Tax=Portunus trituberculatus TaxID=210409 RepID=A0A5B7JTG6_PORTR|nr:hypothetical protein [Portunus trituberculatus]